jgi:hypothetical protein
MKAACLAGTAALAVLASFTVAAGAEEPHVAPVTEYINANVAPWLVDPVIVNAIKDQNAANAALTQSDIDGLDGQWKAEVESGSRPMIDKVLGAEISKFLAAKQQEAGGMITEVFIMDNKGLNVGQSDVTSDYWQGDEAKWQKSYGAGAGAIFVDEVEKDESTQTLQTQASIAIADPATNEVIGAVTIGIDVGGL